jgi:hypothetical protein
MDSKSESTAPGLPYPAKQALNTEKVSIGILLCGFDKKLSRARAEIDLNRMIVPKDFGEYNGRENIG